MKDRMTMDEAREYCLKMERDRERYQRTTRQGAFESAILSLDAHMAGFDDPSKIAAFSDGGRGAERITGDSRGRAAEVVADALRRLPPADRAFAKAVLSGKSWREMGYKNNSGFYKRLERIERFFGHTGS